MAGSKHILFVEDDRLISEMYARALRSKGYKVDFAYTGTEGLEKGKGGNYGLILLDIMMPGLTGIEVLHQLRGKDGKGLGDTKIVILTNLGQDKTSEEALKAQADGYLIKAEVVPSELAEIVAQLI